MKKYALIVAGGSGSRMKSELPKQFIEIGGKPILMHTLSKFSNCDEIVLVLPESQIEFWSQLCKKYNYELKHTIIKGGESRFQSVKKGLEKVDKNTLVTIHDGVRPFITSEIIENSFKTAQEKGNAIVGVDSKDSLRKISAKGNAHVYRSEYKIIQTPQTFNSSQIKEAYNQEEKSIFTDDASVLEALGESIHLIEGDYRNIKITSPEDLIIAEAYLSNSL